MAFVVPGRVEAFPVTTYAENSVLAEGNWVKVSVVKDGIHFISNAMLRQWGFADAASVNVYGYGGRRISDVLDVRTYVDDLPVVQTLRTAAGIYFYAEGPVNQRRRSEYISPLPNPFGVCGYYYLSDRDATPRGFDSGDTTAPATSGSTRTTDYAYHEVESVSPGEVGHMLVGEDFMYTRSQTFNIDLPDRAEGTPVLFEASFVSSIPSDGSTLTYSVNNEPLREDEDGPVNDDRISKVNDSYSYGTETLTRRMFTPSGTRMVVNVTLNGTSTVALANLNYLSLTYERELNMPAGATLFTCYSDGAVTLKGATATTHILDVTDPLNIKAVNASATNGGMTWQPVGYASSYRYAAFNEGGAGIPAPTFVGRVENQNLHALPNTDMVIICVDEYQSEAERLAELHRTQPDPLTVTVIPQSLVYNEFGSGVSDVNSLRRLLKMFYDRSKGAADGAPRLRYALMMGRAYFDNRLLTSTGKALTYKPMPTWMTNLGLNSNSAYTTDDIFAFLEDGSGRSFSSDSLSIAVGRLPVKSIEEARTTVSKIISYVTEPKSGDWRNRALLVADDEDGGRHMTQAKDMEANMRASDGGKDIFYKKLYTDAYERSNGTYPEARNDLFRTLDEGIVWWSYNGHANPTSWTHEGLMTYNDINSLYLRYQPFVYAATCDFMRWDCTQVSGAEILFLNDGSGTIGTISAVRPVYISDNGDFSKAIGNYAFARKEDGSRYTVGEIMQMAKNNYGGIGKPKPNSNRLRYVLLGDPAMRLAVPENSVTVDRMGDIEVGGDAIPEIKARQDVVIEGHVVAPDGSPVTGVDGTVTYTIYDAEQSITTRANGKDGKEVTFEQQGSRLATGRGRLADGKFTLEVSMPSEIADNYRKAALNIFVDNDDVTRQAVTHFTDFYVYDTDWDAAPDTDAPVIEALYLNNASFESGDIVNASPMLFATISDNKAINLSTAGIGHQMLITLDGGKTYNDVADYYTPSEDGSPSGVLAYPLTDLAEGTHEVRLRVWDTSSNSASRSIEFGVSGKVSPVIYDVYTDANPASVETNFYLVHDRPDQKIEVTISVYNLMGQRVWSTTTSQRSDMYASSPIRWDLCDEAGRRVRRGIYLYRATIIEPETGRESNTAAKRIAVTG